MLEQVGLRLPEQGPRKECPRVAWGSSVFLVAGERQLAPTGYIAVDGIFASLRNPGKGMSVYILLLPIYREEDVGRSHPPVISS
jgi:hypothetical protein